jgi:hypothetical protein
MVQYLKIFRNHDEYENSGEKPVISHCVKEVHIHFDNCYYQFLDGGNPGEGDYDLDGGYYFI